MSKSKGVIVFFLALFINGMVSVLWGQEKSLSYYNQHPDEILRDAQSFFKKGDYEKTISLCQYHYIIVGDSAAEDLRSKAELCERLTNEINERTERLRSANPDDPLASKLYPAKSVLDSIHVMLNNDRITSSEGFSDDKSTKDNETDSFTEVENDINGMQWVDLGLPSGIKWATKNIGAKQNSDFGSFFSWDEKKLKDSDGIYIIMSKASEPYDAYWTHNASTQKDAATLLWGNPWRMPNEKDWEELKMFCSWRWMIMNGHAGYLVVSRKNGNNIFLPACGYCGTLNNRDVGQQGYYWSSTPRKGESRKGNGLLLNERDVEMKTFPFSFGLSIRAVSD